MKFNFVLGGNLFELWDLEDAMNKAFLKLHGAYLGNKPCNLADFEKEAINFFDSAAGNFNKQNKFFENFSKYIWSHFFANRIFDSAEQVWKIALNPAYTWEEKNKSQFIHKGTPLYFWGMTVILKGDIDKGYALMHQALEEDIRTFPDEFREKPGFAFATLNYQKTDQAFREWVLNQVRFLNRLINKYIQIHGRDFILDKFCNDFLSSLQDKNTIFLFTYALARLLKLNEIDSRFLKSDFASQLQLNLLFDIIIVIDAAIKEKNENQWKLIDHIAFLSREAGLPLDNKKLGKVNKLFEENPDVTLKNIINGLFKFDYCNPLLGLSIDLVIAYVLRNYRAHKTTSLSTIPEKFQDIQQSLFNVLFLCAEELYGGNQP